MQRNRTLWIIFFVFSLCVVGFFYIAIKQGYFKPIINLLPKPDQPAPGYYKVIVIYDGDTIGVDMAGTVEKVRFIGIDTPETHKPNAAKQCFGEEASRFTEDLLANRTVRLEADPTNTNRDRYDRLLRYVYTEDGRLAEQLIIESGHGFAYTPFPFEKKQAFLDFQKTAQENSVGLWAACQINQKDGVWHTNDVE